MIAVNRIAIVALAALLAGCASTPQPNSEPAVRYFVSKQPAASVPVAATPAEQKPSEVEFKPEPRKVDAETQQCLAQAMYWEARG